MVVIIFRGFWVVGKIKDYGPQGIYMQTYIEFWLQEVLGAKALKV